MPSPTILPFMYGASETRSPTLRVPQHFLNLREVLDPSR